LLLSFRATKDRASCSMCGDCMLHVAFGRSCGEPAKVRFWWQPIAQHMRGLRLELCRLSPPGSQVPGQRGRCRSRVATGCLSDLSTAASRSCSMEPQGPWCRHSLARPTFEPILQTTRPWMLPRWNRAFDFPSLRWEHIRMSSIAAREGLMLDEESSGTSAYLVLAWFEVCCLIVEPGVCTWPDTAVFRMTASGRIMCRFEKAASGR